MGRDSCAAAAAADDDDLFDFDDLEDGFVVVLMVVYCVLCFVCSFGLILGYILHFARHDERCAKC